MNAKEVKLPTRLYAPWVSVNGEILTVGKCATEEDAQHLLDNILPNLQGMVSDSGIAKTI